MTQQRPAGTVVLPFHGSPAEAEDALDRLGALSLRPGDRALLVDNTEDGAAGRQRVPPGVEVVVSPVKRSAYAARNIGAERADTPWLLFVDADCRLPGDLLDRYFATPPGDAAGAIAGRVDGTPGQPGLVPAYVRSRRHLDQELLARHPFRPMAVTANLLVRREAWAAVGGFAEHTRSGADADFCWRLLDAGWALEYRDGAVVTHDHRAGLRALLVQAGRDGAGATWLARRHPGYDGLLHARDFARALLGAAAWPLLGAPRRGLFKALDGVWGAAFDVGALGSNAPPEPLRDDAGTIVLLDRFPVAGDPLVASLAASSTLVRVEARRRPERADWASGRRVPASFWEDDAPVRRALEAARHGARRRGRTAPPELGPPARRLRRAAPGGVVLVDPPLAATAAHLLELAGRDDLRVAPLDGRRRVGDGPA